MKPCDQDETGAGGSQPASLGEDAERRMADGNTDTEKEESCPSAQSDSIPPVCEGRGENGEEGEEPHRRLESLDVPDFLLPDAPEGTSGEFPVVSD